ncbi:hypothetical protein ACS0TY_013302 [Phlomoides rotata]
MCQSRFLLWGTYLWEDLDIAIVKATNHYERPAKERHIRGRSSCFIIIFIYLFCIIVFKRRHLTVRFDQTYSCLCCHSKLLCFHCSRDTKICTVPSHCSVHTVHGCTVPQVLFTIACNFNRYRCFYIYI